ncbi:MAG: hypothetical protein LBV41_12030 [Cytophagaceae bacterium]|nr:hypothetical protein [Cytophagaceae bacterium]
MSDDNATVSDDNATVPDDNVTASDDNAIVSDDITALPNNRTEAYGGISANIIPLRKKTSISRTVIAAFLRMSLLPVLLTRGHVVFVNPAFAND